MTLIKGSFHHLYLLSSRWTWLQMNQIHSERQNYHNHKILIKYKWELLWYSLFTNITFQSRSYFIIFQTMLSLFSFNRKVRLLEEPRLSVEVEILFGKTLIGSSISQSDEESNNKPSLELDFIWKTIKRVSFQQYLTNFL